jgi:hypothetical protein
MKIFTLPIEKRFRPDKQIFKYPRHNKDYGVEQDFFEYIKNNPELSTDNPDEADWHYLPIFWTRLHLNNNYGKNGLEELQKECNNKILDSKKTFCICQYDDGPLVNIGDTTQFLASRKSSIGIDIPLLSSPHRLPFLKQKKKFIASFIGRLSTHKIRIEMSNLLKDNKNILILNGNFGSRFFVKNTLKSLVSLCPRGYGGSSFRIFESMQLGVCPFLIGDLDTRPFKDFIDWNEFSLYTNSVEDIENKMLHKTKEQLIIMGEKAKDIYNKEIGYQKWCKYVLKELSKKQ